MFTSSKRFLLGILCFALGACGGAGGGGNETSPSTSLTRPSNYTLKWQDDFTDATLGNAWDYDLGSPLLGGTVWGNSEQQFYTNDISNVRTLSGNLYIQPVQGIPPSAPQNLSLLATSARIKTDTAAYYSALNSSPYGFYEIRAQIPCVAGAWPAIWMMGRTGAWPDRGEIDIAEWFGRYFSASPNQIQSGIHVTNHAGANSLYAKKDISSLCNGFHTYQLHWTSSVLIMGVDGVEVFRYNKPLGAVSADWPFDQPAFFVLNVAVGGNLGGSVNIADIPSMTMVVDWVKVWQP